MTFLDVVVVAFIRGLGEALPVGASGHLAALPALAGSPEGRAALAIAADIGILVALALYFWRDLFAMGQGLWRLFKGRPDAGTRLLGHVVAGSVPAAALGWLFLEVGGGFGGAVTAAAAMVVFGLFLLVSDNLGMTVSRVEHMSLPAAMAIGVLQAAALIPGVSRTGITITAARLMGYERRAAARFSLLLAIPLLGADAVRTVWRLSREASLILSSDLLLASGVAALAALVGTALMMAWVRRHTFAPFAVWRILFGAAVLGWMWWR